MDDIQLSPIQKDGIKGYIIKNIITKKKKIEKKLKKEYKIK